MFTMGRVPIFCLRNEVFAWIHAHLQRSLSEVVSPLGLVCHGVEWLPAGSDSCLRVYIECSDPEREVDVDDCEAASREISAWLDVEDPISGHFRLEVSSPGLERPLFNAGQVAEVTGETIKVKLRLARDGSRKFKGKVRAVEGDIIHLDCEDKGEIDLDFANIEHARVEPDWAALGLAPTPRNSSGGHKGKSKQKRAHRRTGRS